ncbi:RNA-binding protein BRN1-like isoform X3 [Primulina eburnea]|uniref:RNA-binding protein BRN1-like isoform X3 n=1 Tax=Primulina eburnea TaxID=1245227 RepID=UPI003C6C9900
MAEAEQSVKLFVGQVPKHLTESQLLAMFREFAIVDEVNIIKEKETRASRGCCFVICPSRDEADKAVAACHNKKTLPGASSPLQVKYADGELERLEHKLFIGMLPKNVSDADVLTLFSEYGGIKDLQILRGSQQTSKGCAFLKFETKEQALSAIEALNGKHKMEGSTVPLVVKWADTEKERQSRRAQKALSQTSNPLSADSRQHPSLFGALPMGYMPPYNGYGYQVHLHQFMLAFVDSGDLWTHAVSATTIAESTCFPQSDSTFKPGKCDTWSHTRPFIWNDPKKLHVHPQLCRIYLSSNSRSSISYGISRRNYGQSSSRGAHRTSITYYHKQSICSIFKCQYKFWSD